MRPEPRILIDNVEGKFVRLSPKAGVWIDVVPFRPVVQSVERADLCWLVYLEGAATDPAIAVYEYDGTCLWSRTREALPMHDVPGTYMLSTMMWPEGPEPRLNRGNAWCVIEDERIPRFGPVQHRVARPRGSPPTWR